MAIGLSVPAIVVNGDTVAIVPNSFKYSGGEGEINVRAASSGGDQVETVHTANAETKISMVSFEMYITPGIDGQIADWKGNIGENTIEAGQTSVTGNFTLSFSRMSLVNDVSREAGQDGKVPLEFKGDPMSRQASV